MKFASVLIRLQKEEYQLVGQVSLGFEIRSRKMPGPIAYLTRKESISSCHRLHRFLTFILISFIKFCMPLVVLFYFSMLLFI